MKVTKFMKGGMAAVMAMTLAACSSGSNGGGSGSTASGALKIGGSGPLSGDAAVYGTAVKNGASLAIKEINASDDYTVKFSDLDFQDDEADTEKAVTAFNQLLSDGIQVSIGTTTSGSGQAVSQLYKDNDIFAITPSGSSTAIIYQDAENEKDPYGNVFQMCFTDPNQGTASADYISEHELGSKIAVIYRNDDNYSSGIYKTFMNEAEKKNLNVVYEGTFQDGATDYSVQVKAAKDAGADLVFLPIYYQPAYQILTEAKKQDYAPTFFGCDGMDGILTMDGVNPADVEGLYMLTPYSADSTDEKSAAFTKAYQDEYGETPNQFAADAYDAVYAIAQACDEGKVTADMATSDITDTLVKEFTSMTFSGVTGSNVTWNKNGEVTKDPRAIIVKDGKYVSAE